MLSNRIQKKYPKKFVSEATIFNHIHRGDRIFVGTGCGQPQYLVKALTNYVASHPTAFFDTEVLQIWTMGIAPYLQDRFRRNFRLNSFFIGKDIRNFVNEGKADYVPIFLSEIPALFNKKMIPIDVALIQTSPFDHHGYGSLGISVDIVKSAMENARLVIAQVNSNMPRVHGDSYIHIDDVDFILEYDEPLLTFEYEKIDESTQKIGEYVARIIKDGDTIQVGYGSLANHILASLSARNHLGVHTELLHHGVVELMKSGVVDNTQKPIDRGKTVATFCMGNQDTYDYLHDNPKIEFRVVDYTNNPLIIARIKNIATINTALEIDLTGQATADSIGTKFFSGIGGQADFMRGAILAPGGKSILALKSTAKNEEISRIVPVLSPGAGVTLTRGDIDYVITEYGIAYLHGKNVRERAISLIAIAHPKFRAWLIEEAKRLNFIYQDQKFIPGKGGEYPEHLETYRTTGKDVRIFLRPVKFSDEPLLKDFFYTLSDKSMYQRFASARYAMPHERLQDFIAIDFNKELVILAILEKSGKEIVVGLGQYYLNQDSHSAEVAFVVRDDYQNKGIGTEIISYLAFLAKKQGLYGFTAQVLATNETALYLIKNSGVFYEKKFKSGIYEIELRFD